METVKGKSIFVDTNILVYCNNKDSAFCKPAREKLTELIKNANRLFISDQVIREYLVIMTKPGVLENPISPKLAIQDVTRMREEFNLLFADRKALDMLADLIVKYGIKGKRVHDTAIVSIMLAKGISDIVTHNVNDFKYFNDLTIHSI